MSKDEDKARVERAQLNKSVTEDWAAHLESIILHARMTRAKYVALVREGFSEAQAIELCK